MSSFLLFQQFSSCATCLTWIVFEMGGKCPYSCYFVGYCFQDLFKTASSIFVSFPSCLFFWRFVRVRVQPYSSTDTVTAWKSSRIVLSERSDFYIVNNLLIVIHVLSMHLLISLSIHVKHMLYIDLRPGQTCHSKDGGSAYSVGVGELG